MKNALPMFALALAFAFYGCQQEDTQQTEKAVTQQHPKPAPAQPPQKSETVQEAAEQQSTAQSGQEESEKAKETAISGQEAGQKQPIESDKPVDGAEIFLKNKCGTCHQPDIDRVGPSLHKIAQAYKDKNADLIAFLKGERESIVDPSKAAMMKPLLMPLKSLSEEEHKALADYIILK